MKKINYRIDWQGDVSFWARLCNFNCSQSSMKLIALSMTTFVGYVRCQKVMKVMIQIHVLFIVKYRYKQRQHMDKHTSISYAVLKDVLMGIPKSDLSGDLLGVTVGVIHVARQQYVCSNHTDSSIYSDHSYPCGTSILGKAS